VSTEISAAALRDAPLGRAAGHPDHYAPALLYPVPRAPQRAALGIGAHLPFTGADSWTAYDLTWLDAQGKPRIAIAALQVPVDSPMIVESKSMKLYLGSFAQSRYAADADVAAVIARDLSHAAGAPVLAALHEPAAFAAQPIAEPAGESLDELPVACDAYDVAPDLLSAYGPAVSETLTTGLFRSVCPVTAQPDIASMQIAYRGPRIDRAGLLRYLVSYRCHAGFHEHCVERIFVDVAARCRCEQLTVYARFTRRGGIDINPYRTNTGSPPPANVRAARQ